MDKLHKLKLFKDLQEVSNRYSQLNIENNEIEDNKNLQELIINYKSNMDTIRKRANFISKQTREDAKDSSLKDIYIAGLELNKFASEKYNEIIESSIDIESTPVKAVLLATLDELLLINQSIKNKEYLKDKATYFYIYEKISINAFIIFLVLKDIKNIEKIKIEKLSQGILSQIQTLSLISI